MAAFDAVDVPRDARGQRERRITARPRAFTPVAARLRRGTTA
jgi:hypothetical protein